MEKFQQEAFGRPILSWEVDEYRKHERSTAWFVISGIIGAILLVISIVTANYLFALIILMVGLLTFISSFKNPERVDVSITTTGVVIGGDFYQYKELRDFSIVYEPPEIKLLYVDFKSNLHPTVSIPLEEIDPNKAREALLPYVIENLERDKESLTDMMSRLYKI
ncbi:TPA: hypothetical protein DCZ32_03215 [Candidatus Uhrbacteria bacterium]|nr:hypothetical protein [Candidatus Uhrbacteria bacterium]